MTGELGRGGHDLFGLLPGGWPGWAPEELDRVYFQNVRQLPDDLQPHPGHCPLDPAHVCPVHPGVVRQLLLGELPPVPDAPEVGRKKFAQVHVPTEAICGLLAHGFKASNGRRTGGRSV